MSIQLRLTIMSFLQFFVWGAWLITIGVYWFENKIGTATEFGAIFSTMGLASLVMPTLSGIIADKWINAERLYALLHLLYGAALVYLTQVTDPNLFFWIMLGAMFCYMPTIALSNAIAYSVLQKNNLDVVKYYPPIRVWGTVGFIAAMWITNLSGNKATEGQFYIAAVGAFALAAYALTLPASPPMRISDKSKSFSEAIGLKAFKLFSDYKMALFFVFSMFLGAALQLTNMYGDTFLSHFGEYPEYADSLIVKNSTIVMSISQISETLFILAIPFFLKKFGIKQVMLISMLAWVLRFGLLAYSDPAGGLWMIIMSCIIYGMAFDFFNISGSLFVETNTSPAIRSSAQGMFMMMTNGFGAILGSYASGYAIEHFLTDADGNMMWTEIWLCFAFYSLIIAFLFSFLFKHKHTRTDEIT